MTATNARSVLVIGGGLSGIVLAHELALRGWQVTLLERSGRLDGKAGSELRNGRRVEHGLDIPYSGRSSLSLQVKSIQGWAGFQKLPYFV